MNKITFPLKRQMRGPQVADLQDALKLLLERGLLFADDEGARRELLPALQRERAEQLYGNATAKLVARFQEEHRLQPTGEVDQSTAEALNALLRELGLLDQPPEPGPRSYRVEGMVASRTSASIGGLRVVIVDKGVGGDLPLAETITDPEGRYQAGFTDSQVRQRGKDKPDVQARVFLGETFLGASEVRYNASEHEILDVLLDEGASATLHSEYETLTGTLASHFRGRLADLQETDDRQDITYLANKTGWDARAVALAALADQFSARTAGPAGAPAIPPHFFYALFRAGLPANEDVLYHTDGKTLEAVWKQAAEQGVIPKTSVEEIPNLVARFQELSAQKLLTGPALVGASSLKEMLTLSGLNESQQETFARLYAAHRTDMPAFWQAVGNALGPERARRLQVDGKLAFLTVNNAPLTQKLHAAAGPNGLSDPVQLAQMGYHRPEKWNALLADLPVPKEIPGDTPETRRANYASYLAAQVRLSYPTAAMAEMVQSRELPLTGAPDGLTDKVHAFLTEHQGKFEIGVHPVEQYVAKNRVQVDGQVVQQVKRLQRVYQITPGDRAMTGLMRRGIDAAYHVMRYDKETFVRTFAEDLGGADQAALTYDRAAQVHNAVLNVALGYLYACTAPAIGLHSPPSVVDPAPAQASDVIAYATLEKIFGSMDFCACEHCRSILSPAAYLVDLLLFLDQPHPPTGTENPQTVLLERRPDLQHLPLTCENTNTALPYIDVVNETLEYFIANNVQKLSLKDYKGHDTGSTTSEDLLASPQFVMDAAYTTLRNESFPAPLPFHQPLETLRRYFNKFEVPLSLAMERLRKSDDLERGTNPYGWRDIWMEELGLSRAEHEILTDAAAVPLWRMYGFPNGTADADVIAGLSNARQFARRLGLAYEELVAILRTRFINPHGDLIPKLERLGVSIVALKALKDGAISDSAFDALLPTGLAAPDPAEYGGDIKAWVKDNDNYARIMGLITLAVPAGPWTAARAYALGDCVRPTTGPVSTLYYVCTKAGTSGASEPPWPTVTGKTFNDGTVEWTCRDAADCRSFEDLAFRYSDPGKLTQNLGAVEFVRLLRFIRLWKKLGWTIEETDAALSTLYRADLRLLEAGDIDTVAKLDAGFKTLLPRLGIVLRVMEALNLTVKRDLQSLLACWSEIGTHGDGALYRQMFLNPAILRQDPVFADNGYGEFLTDTTQKLSAHAEALRAAFNLTGDEYDRIVTDLGYDANTPLTLSNISAIFRRGWLARKLKLSVRELLLLIRLTGLDPFASPDPIGPAILRLVVLLQAMKERSFKSAAALYIIWNQDLSGKSSPTDVQVANFARTLRQALAAVEAEFTVADDPDGAIAQAQLAKVYDADAAGFYFGLLNDTFTVEVNFSDPDGTMTPGPVRQAIEAAAGKTEAGVPRIAYDDFRKRLVYTGVLGATTQNAIKTAEGGGATAFKTAVDALYDRNQAAIGPFFTRYPELQAPYEAYVADTSHSAAEKRNNLLQAILPELIRRRKRQQVLQSLSAAANTSLDFTQTLLDAPSAPFPLHAVGKTDRAALEDILATETPGLSVRFFAADTATGTPMSGPNIPDTASDLDYAPTVNPLPANPTPGNAISGVWHGYLEAPESGFFNLHIEADAMATVTLTLDGKSVTLAQTTTRWSNTNPIELRAGALYEVELKVEKVKDSLHVQWEWTPKGQGRRVIPGRSLYPATVFERFRETYIRLLKAASLATGLGLTAGELAWFATHGDYQINGDGWLNALGVKGDPEPMVAQALLKPLEALLDFARIKAEVAPGDESLLAVLRDPAKATEKPNSLLFAMTRWNPGSLNDLLAWFGGNVAGLGSFGWFRRVYDAMVLTRQLGISAQMLTQATTNEPTADTVREWQAVLRARYDAADWREVIRPINDEMRTLQRDALVAYILHQMGSHPESAHIDTPEKLFEYFLMDVQMDPCMLTSRIRFALSSVQMFIERCLMNLEPRVSPAAINAKQWEWMKRYRVWEANRKVYLFPENWLEPELRDDPSPFFKETMSELLQGDITEERAAVTLLNYLSKLEEVAKLEPCGLHYIPADPARRTGEVVHVVARTAGARRKYYYRRYEYGYWTPWEEIKLDIEDNPVVPVVWNDRLFLFWLRILKQGPNTVEKPFSKEGDLVSLKTSDIKTDPPKVTVQALLCWSEYYNGKWQATRTSDAARPLGLGGFAPDGFDRSRLSLSVLFWTKGALRIIVSYENSFGTSFFLHNAYSTPELREGKKEPHFSPKRALETTTDTLRIGYPDFNTANDVAHNAISDRAVQPNHPVEGDPWDPPFFYEDARHVFYVTTEGQASWVPEWNFPWIPVKPPPVVLHIPPLVVPPIPIPDPIGPVTRQPGFGTINPSPVERYVTEDAYVHRGIGTSGTVRYGEKEIGVAGSQVKSIRTK
jgi:peptidoglycan hydrolase-like protein with peptidoglycan-binding domain